MGTLYFIRTYHYVMFIRLKLNEISWSHLEVKPSSFLTYHVRMYSIFTFISVEGKYQFQKQMKHGEKVWDWIDSKFWIDVVKKLSLFKHMIKLYVQYRPTTLIEKKGRSGQGGKKMCWSGPPKISSTGSH